MPFKFPDGHVAAYDFPLFETRTYELQVDGVEYFAVAIKGRHVIHVNVLYRGETPSPQTAKAIARKFWQPVEGVAATLHENICDTWITFSAELP